MRKIMKTNFVLLVVSYLTSCFLFISLSFGQEMPKPGEMIDKSNYKKYAHLFPEQFLPGFENGFDGTFKPFSVKVVQSKPAPIPKKFVVLSEKNRGKFTFDKDGKIVGGYDYNGFPFPGVTPEDKDFSTKIMWNYGYQYFGDSSDQLTTLLLKRKGEQVSYFKSRALDIRFTNRLYDNPKPFYETPEKIFKVYGAIYYEPSNLRNFQFRYIQYLDVTRADDGYLYLPQMRRVLRAEAGFRSTPPQGVILAWDDFYGFSGKTQNFTYKYLGEKKVLGTFESSMCNTFAVKGFAADKNFLPFANDNWEVRDVYVIEITSKDPKYPQSKKTVYIDKENLRMLYTVMLDRAGKPWKIAFMNWRPTDLADGDKFYYLGGISAYDMQFGIGQVTPFDVTLNGNRYMYDDVMPSAMVKIGR